MCQERRHFLLSMISSSGLSSRCLKDIGWGSLIMCGRIQESMDRRWQLLLWGPGEIIELDGSRSLRDCMEFVNGPAWTGWECPRCGIVWAPFVQQCTCSRPTQSVPTNNTGSSQTVCPVCGGHPSHPGGTTACPIGFHSVTYF